MSLTLTTSDILIFLLGMIVGYLIPHGRRYAGRYYNYYRRRRR